MASYDSDSSEGEFEETSVLLGYASKDADDDTISHLGGQPEWLDPEAPPSAAYAKCKVCKDLMVLLLQLNGELPEKFPEHERRIYVFACRRASCRRKQGSIRALRGVRVWKEVAPKEEATEAKKEEEEEQKKPKNDGPGLGNTLFGAKGLGAGGAPANPFSSNANPFSSSTSNSSNPFSTGPSSNPFSSQPAKPAPSEEAPAAALPKTFAESLNIGASSTSSAPPPPAEPWPEKLPEPYTKLYLADADFETLDPKPAKVPQNARLEDADSAEPSVLDREAFESTMDSTFQKFADRLAQNPEQVIRYEFSGAPLLYSKTDAAGEAISKGAIPRCSTCASRRVFEVQLTPNAIFELEGDDLSLDGMEWGTIIVAVCERDCSPRGTELTKTGYVEEWAGVQWEELTTKKK